MKVRIVKPQLMYYGEVYKNNKWKCVTMPCHTRLGAKISLKKYARENGKETFFI